MGRLAGLNIPVIVQPGNKAGVILDNRPSQNGTNLFDILLKDGTKLLNVSQDNVSEVNG